MASVLRIMRQEISEKLSIFASQRNINYSYASQIERGERSASRKYQVLMAKELGVAVEELFDECGYAVEAG